MMMQISEKSNAKLFQVCPQEEKKTIFQMFVE